MEKTKDLLPENGYIIMQLEDSADLTKHFAGYEYVISKAGGAVTIADYQMVYAAVMWWHKKDSVSPTAEAVLEELFVKFNTSLPDDFTGHSLSVSDVVVLNINGQTDAWYVDTFGFKKLPDTFWDMPKRHKRMYAVSGRCGTELLGTEIFQTEEEAHAYIDSELADCVLNDAGEHLGDLLYEDETQVTRQDLAKMGVKELVDWGVDHDIINGDRMAYTFSHDWQEYEIQPVMV